MLRIHGQSRFASQRRVRRNSPTVRIVLQTVVIEKKGTKDLKKALKRGEIFNHRFIPQTPVENMSSVPSIVREYIEASPETLGLVYPSAGSFPPK